MRPDEKKPYIFLSFINTEYLANDPEIFDYIYEKIATVANARGFRVFWQISKQLTRILSDKETGLKRYRNLTNDRKRRLHLMKRAELVIVDTAVEAAHSLRYKKETLLFYRSGIPMELKSLLIGLKVVNNFELLIKESDRIMALSGHEMGQKSLGIPFLLDCPSVLQGSDVTRAFCIEPDSMGGDSNAVVRDLVLWEKYHLLKKRISLLLEKKRYDELMLIFSDLNKVTEKKILENGIPCSDSDIISAFIETMNIQGEKERALNIRAKALDKIGRGES